MTSKSTYPKNKSLAVQHKKGDQGIIEEESKGLYRNNDENITAALKELTSSDDGFRVFKNQDHIEEAPQTMGRN